MEFFQIPVYCIQSGVPTRRTNYDVSVEQGVTPGAFDTSFTQCSSVRRAKPAVFIQILSRSTVKENGVAQYDSVGLIRRMTRTCHVNQPSGPQSIQPQVGAGLLALNAMRFKVSLQTAIIFNIQQVVGYYPILSRISLDLLASFSKCQERYEYLL